MEQLKHANAIEKQIASRIVDDALKAGYAVSVFDGEEFPLKRSTDRAAILEAMTSTDADTLHFRKPDGTRIGWVMLIWGNGSDLISDNTDNPETNALLKGASALSDRLAS